MPSVELTACAVQLVIAVPPTVNPTVPPGPVGVKLTPLSVAVSVTDWFTFVAPVGIQVRGRPVADVGAELAKISQVLTVAVVIGPQDLEIQVVARDLAELAVTLTDIIAKTEGVGRITPGLALQILKYESTWVPF